MPICRVYADFNGLKDSARTQGKLALHLHYFGSLRDISRLKLRLYNGLHLNVYSDSAEQEDIEASGSVYFDKETNLWFVEFDEQDIRYVPTKPDPKGIKFPCWNCAVELNELIQANGLAVGDVCPHCGQEIHELLKAPR